PTSVSYKESEPWKSRQTVSAETLATARHYLPSGLKRDEPSGRRYVLAAKRKVGPTCRVAT
ncbi:MAG: hypothetical protein NXI32_29660, partial [bacterium]|nr:hypothetical protein [bacterium]